MLLYGKYVFYFNVWTTYQNKRNQIEKKIKFKELLMTCNYSTNIIKMLNYL